MRSPLRAWLLASIGAWLLLVLPAPPASASAGQLDRSFGQGGKQHADLAFGDDPDTGVGVAVQPDGKIVVAAQARVLGDFDFVIARYTKSGEPDPSFGGGDGRVYTTFSGSATNDLAYDVVLQPDGKIVVVGSTVPVESPFGTGRDLALARYDQDGSLDPGFGEGGLVTSALPDDQEAEGVVLQPDGKIVVVGYHRNDRGSDFLAARYLTDGELDGTFSRDGVRTFSVGRRDDEATDVAFQPNGSLDVAGSSFGGSVTGWDVAMARLRADGSLDRRFGDEGRVVTDIGTDDLANAIALQSDGRIVVAGSAGSQKGGTFALARYGRGGALDETFSGNGLRRVSFGAGSSFARGVAVAPDQAILVVGGAVGDWALARLLPSGALDDDFAGNGKQTTEGFSSPSGEHAEAVALQGDGRIVVVGEFEVGSRDTGTCRYLGD